MTLKYIEYLKEADEPKEKKVKVPEQKLILSDKFKEVLNSVRNMQSSNISKRLLELESSDQLFDLSYVDIDKDGEGVTYLLSNKIERLKKEGKPIEEFWTTKMRTPQKIGRFIKQLLPKFSEDALNKFILKFKTVLKESDEEVNFETVDGDDIVYWYNSKNYANQSGSLGGSCMGGREAGRYLNCYRNNPEQCKMVILKNTEGDKIRGRALLWKLSEPADKIFMDRVYVNKVEDVLLFTNYAKKQGWMYKDEQLYGETYIVTPEGGKKYMTLEVVLDNVNYDLYPYVDTLRYFYQDIKTMSSDDTKKGHHITLTDTEGHYEEWSDDDDDYNPTVYDGYNKEDISERDAQWCEYDDGYIRSSDAVRLAYNGKYAYPNSPHIVFSEYTKKWYAKTDCTFCKPLNTWVWNKYVVDLYHDKNKEIPSDKTHRFEINKTIGKIGDDYFDIDLLYPIETNKVSGKNGKTKTEVIYGFKEDQENK